MSDFDLEAGWSHWPAPAKLNLFLRIPGRRADGYHELQTVFRLLDWGDRIALRMREDGQVRRVGVSVPGVAEADDLVVRAAIALRKAANSAKGADIRVEKRIPAGGGFGGKSAGQDAQRQCGGRHQEGEQTVLDDGVHIALFNALINDEGHDGGHQHVHHSFQSRKDRCQDRGALVLAQM